MRIRVTKPITKYGRYYAAGEILEEPTDYERGSLRRLHQWEILPDSEPSLRSLNKPALIEVAESRGLDVAGLSKREIVEVLEA